MKILALFFFVSLILADCYGQDLKNTEWIKIKVERLDGSRVVDRGESEDASLQYYFSSDSVLVSTNQQYSSKLKYTVHDKMLTIGSFARYKIDSISDVLLFISQLSNSDAPVNKLNRYILINADYLYDYLKKNNRLQIEDDSVAICDSQFSPTYLGDFTNLFTAKEFDTYSILKSAKGIFTISPDGVVKDVTVDENKYFTAKEINRIKNIFYATSGSWVLPPSPVSLSFKMKFAFSLSNNFGGTLFYINFLRPDHGSLTSKQRDEEYTCFDKGARLFNNKKFEEASQQFAKCIAIDSLDLDAYYNLAACYQKLGNKEKACGTWKKLKDMGQKNGEILYNQNCQ